MASTCKRPFYQCTSRIHNISWAFGLQWIWTWPSYVDLFDWTVVFHPASVFYLSKLPEAYKVLDFFSGCRQPLKVTQSSGLSLDDSLYFKSFWSTTQIDSAYSFQFAFLTYLYLENCTDYMDFEVNVALFLTVQKSLSMDYGLRQSPKIAIQLLAISHASKAGFLTYTNFKHLVNFGRIPGLDSKTYYYFTWQNSLKTEKGKSIPTGKLLLICIHTWTISVQHEGQSQNPDGKKSPPIHTWELLPIFQLFWPFFNFAFPIDSDLLQYMITNAPDPQTFFKSLSVTLMSHFTSSIGWIFHTWELRWYWGFKNDIWSKTRNSGFHLF